MLAAAIPAAVAVRHAVIVVQLNDGRAGAAQPTDPIGEQLAESRIQRAVALVSTFAVQAQHLRQAVISLHIIGCAGAAVPQRAEPDADLKPLLPQQRNVFAQQRQLTLFFFKCLFSTIGIGAIVQVLAQVGLSLLLCPLVYLAAWAIRKAGA